jgi:hypothetical protein
MSAKGLEKRLPMYRDLRRYWNRISIWTSTTFGQEILTNEIERSSRLLEETIELAQACGLSKELCQRILDRTYSRPVGSKRQEAAGVFLCFLAWLSSQPVGSYAFDRLNLLQYDVDSELYRLETGDVGTFRAKHLAKYEAGTGMKPTVR